ncbi:MAG TPA: TIGR04141 family sporadically distributed protein [Woeseiaceae bacterium]|nr:TIGR04141 family sporadically distributed protein [Woeseiaceae bacterium]
MAKQKTVKINAYLLKEDYELGDPIVSDGKMSETEVEIANSGPGLLYIAQNPSRAPDWAWFLSPVDEDAIKNLRVASVSVILILRAENRYFAACFGHGYAHVDKKFVEARFGLRTCLNVVDPETIRFLDKRTFDSLGKLSREQSTRPVTVSEFGLEVDKDLLRSIVGKPKDERFGKQIAGRDSVGVRIPITASQLPSFLRRCYRESKKDSYRKDFAFIDNIAEISDPRLVDRLNNKLVGDINQGSLSKIWMAVPDIIKWESSAGFRYATAKSDLIQDDIRLRDFLSRWEYDGDLSIDGLKKRHVYQFDSDESTVIGKWSAHHCLYAEISLDQKTYVLTEGCWYNVNDDFVQSVQEEIDAIETFGKELSIWGDEHEQEYNQRVSDQSDGHYALMDRKQINHGGGSSSIEFCDLMSADREIIHVKNYSGSSVLSHLFHQGTVSAFLTAGDPSFRQKVNEKLPNTHKIPEDGTFHTSDYEVVYAIGTRTPMTFDLPFFSKVSLRNSVRQLRVSQYRVSFAKVRRQKIADIS